MAVEPSLGFVLGRSRLVVAINDTDVLKLASVFTRIRKTRRAVTARFKRERL